MFHENLYWEEMDDIMMPNCQYIKHNAAIVGLDKIDITLSNILYIYMAKWHLVCKSIAVIMHNSSKRMLPERSSLQREV